MTDATTLLPDPSARLEAAFRAVHAERMQGLAFVNSALCVEAVGFAPWKGCWLGVMVTPWSMNLLLLPRDTSSWRPLPLGEKRRYCFPAGAFDFVSARDDAAGEYMACSLFSPVLEFADHETARETARRAREALFDVANAEAPPASAPTGAHATDRSPLAQLASGLARPISRRDLLRGRFSRGDDAPRR